MELIRLPSGVKVPILVACLWTIGIALAETDLAAQNRSPEPPVYTPSPPAFPFYPPGCPSAQPAQFGAPLPGLTASQLAVFLVGSNQFVLLENVDAELGPIFNAPTNTAAFPSPICPTNLSCASCHSFPAVGGLVAFSDTRFGVMTPAGFNPLTNLGGSLLHDCYAPGTPPETNPVVNLPNGVQALRQILPLFGDGLVEAIPDGTILLNALRSRGDGVNGRPALIIDLGSTNGSGGNPTHVGRFGWKAQQASLRAFSSDAYDNEEDISNPVFPYDNEPNAAPQPVSPTKDQPDMNGKANIDRFTDFLRFLGPPPAMPLTNVSTIHGAILFTFIGCSRCHTPVLFTGANTNQALAYQPVRLFSDLVLHDMGSLNDNVAQGAANTNQMRTQPLWGVRLRGELGLGRLNHDGLSTNLFQAISRHDGEGRNARNRFVHLGAKDQEDLINFLNTL